MITRKRKARRCGWVSVCGWMQSASGGDPTTSSAVDLCTFMSISILHWSWQRQVDINTTSNRRCQQTNINTIIAINTSTQPTWNNLKKLGVGLLSRFCQLSHRNSVGVARNLGSRQGKSFTFCYFPISRIWPFGPQFFVIISCEISVYSPSNSLQLFHKIWERGVF